MYLSYSITFWGYRKCSRANSNWESISIKCIKYYLLWKVCLWHNIIIGPDRIEMEKKKVDGVLSWPEPKNVKDVRKFLGLANYYRRFIKDFAWVARPINVLMRKDVKWQWGQEQQGAFDELKWIFTTRPVLASPDLDKEFIVEADASNYATEGVLSMKCSNELWRPVAFISKSLSDTEKNYEIHNKCEGDQSRALQEIPQFKLCYRICYNLPLGDSSEN